MSEETGQRLPTPDQVISALDRTGFILEYRVAQKLRQSKFDTFLNHPFTDPDTGKSREIDILASLDVSLPAKDFSVIISTQIIAECKRFELPLAMIGEQQALYHNDEPLIPFDPLQFEFPKSQSEARGDLRAHLDMWRLPSLCTRGFIGSQLIRIDRGGGKWQANNNSVYDSIIYPLAKAVRHERAEIQHGAFGGADHEHESEQRLIPTIFYTFPTLITSGPIYTVDVTPDDTPTVTSVTWAPLTRHFSDGLFLMDVVNFAHIDTYLQQRVFPTIEDAKTVLAGRTHLFDPEWLSTEFGQPSDPIFSEWLSEFKAEYRSP